MLSLLRHTCNLFCGQKLSPKIRIEKKNSCKQIEEVGETLPSSGEAVLLGIRLRRHCLKHRDRVLITTTTIKQDLVINSIITQVENSLVKIFCIKIQVSISGRERKVKISYSSIIYTSYRMSSKVKQL